MAKRTTRSLHKAEERFHHIAERAMAADKKLHRKLEKAHRHEEKKESKLSHAERKAMHHKDKLGEGAKKRRHLNPKSKMKVVMHEFKQGTLRSGSGQKVTNPKQAIAIGYSEARRAKKRK